MIKGTPKKLCLTVGALAVLAWIGVYLSTPPGGHAEVFAVAPGASADVIARGLKQAGFIRSVWLFKLTLKQSGLAAKLQPGEYDLRGVETYGDIISRLAAGGVSADEFVLRLIEGWNLRDIRKRLEAIGYAGAADLFAATGEPMAEAWRSDRRPAPDYSSDFPFLKDLPLGVSLEGYLFPDTYRLYRDASAEEVVRALLANFGRKLTPEMEAKIRASGRSLHEIVTMASVIEKEVRTDPDRQLVSDIFWRRLEAGMPLQSCATVNYVTGKSSPAVSAEDMQVDSAYNTYKYRGLPPGPIGNPGLAALQAAIEPLSNDNWYFLTDDSGRVHYAKDLDEHNRNKSRYLK